MTETTPTVEQNASASAAVPTEAQPQGAPAATPKWELVVDERTRFDDPAKAKDSFLDGRRQIAEFNSMKEKLKGFNIFYEDGRSIPASEDVDGFLALVENLMNPQPAAAKQSEGNEKLDVSKLSPEYQQHIDILTRAGQFATATEFQKMAEKLSQFETQLSGVLQHQSAGDKSRQDAAIAEGRSLLADALKADGLSLSPEQIADIADDIENRIVRASSDPKTGQMLPNSLEERYLNGDRSVREAIVKEQLKKWLGPSESYAKSKNAAQADAKTSAMAAAQPKPLTQAGAGVPAATKARPGESERRQTILQLLSQQSS